MGKYEAKWREGRWVRLVRPNAENMGLQNAVGQVTFVRRRRPWSTNPLSIDLRLLWPDGRLVELRHVAKHKVRHLAPEEITEDLLYRWSLAELGS